MKWPEKVFYQISGVVLKEWIKIRLGVLLRTLICYKKLILNVGVSRRVSEKVFYQTLTLKSDPISLNQNMTKVLLWILICHKKVNFKHWSVTRGLRKGLLSNLRCGLKFWIKICSGVLLLTLIFHKSQEFSQKRPYIKPLGDTIKGLIEIRSKLLLWRFSCHN